MRMLAFLLSDCEYGRILRGAERRFFEVSTRLKNLGVEIFALEYESFHSEGWGQSGYFPIKIKLRFPSHAVLSSLVVLVEGLIACIKYKCDIIYVTSRLAGTEGSWIGLIAPYVVSCLCRRPLVAIFHHVLPRDLLEKNPIRLAAYRRATCMAVSKATASDINKYFHVGGVVIVGNGTDPDLFNSSGCRQKKYDVVFLGRIAEEKGIFDLLTAWKKVVGEIHSAQLLLIGGFERKVEEKLRRTMQELQLRQNVTLSGFVSDKKRTQLLSFSKIFVFPSRMEGFGLAVAEAMAAGLPCIISNLPALKENFNSAAVFVEPGDVEGLAQTILALLSDPRKCRKLIRTGQKLVERFSWEAVAERELEVLRNVCKH